MKKVKKLLAMALATVMVAASLVAVVATVLTEEKMLEEKLAIL